ncbi:uncharacterized protein LOC119359657 [Triticum dicoccoides]|uniref:uncharacterized protein LOC119359657 n=1 Tax=Triticum dicoccoides TaxID=85692 RepID=UPI0018901125|nr:uncharacterized protein LOC119359657 [Triticum dicoccoides]
MFLHHLLLQNMAKNTHQPRSKDGRARGLSNKSPWYQRAVELLLLIWKQPAGAPTTTKAAAAAGVSATGKAAAAPAPAGPGRLRKSSSLNVAASFTRVCLCAPISSYNEPSLYFQPGDVAPRRSYSYPRASSASASGCGANANASPLVAPPPGAEPHRGASGGGEAARRPVFRGKSLTDDHLMRRFVVDEGATRRRNQMEVIRRRHATAAKRRRLGPSPLRRMVLAESESEGDDEAVAETQQRERKRASVA